MDPLVTTFNEQKDILNSYSLLNSNCRPIWNKDTNMHELISNQTLIIYPSTQTEVDTGFHPHLCDQAGLLISNREILTKNGVIMPSGAQVIVRQEGTIKIILRNTSAIPYKVEQGVTKIAQFIVIGCFRFPRL